MSDSTPNVSTLLAQVNALVHKVESLEEELAAVRASEARYRRIVDTANEGVFIADSERRIIYANRHMADMLGVASEELKGSCGERFLFPEDREDYEKRLLRRNQGRSEVYERRFRQADGGTVWGLVSAQPLLDAAGSFEGTLVMVTDITKRKQAEQALRENERKYRIIFENAPLGILWTDAKGRLLECNRTLVELMGSSRERLVGLDLLHNASPGVREYVRQALEGHVSVFEGAYTSITGNVTGFLRAIFTPVWRDGAVNGLIVMVEDISERTRHHEALHSSESRFRNIVQGVANIAVQGYDESRRVVLWNMASERLYGYTQEEALGRRLEDLIIPEPMRAEVVRGVDAWVAGGAAIPPGELVLRHKDGSDVHVYSSHVMQQAPDGSREMFCVDVDLAEVHRMNAELKAAKELAEAASRSKSEFLANMSHEVRTPLNGVMGMLQLLQTTTLDEEQDEYVRTALASSDRLTRLLSDILDLSRIESNRLSLHVQRFPLAALTEPLNDLFLLEARRKGLDFSIRVFPGLPPFLLGDEHRLRQVLFNLVGNAIKFTETGRVDVELFSGAADPAGVRHVVFKVSDTGMGIAPELLADMFEPFTQANASYVRTHQGAGLGLAIVRRLVGLMHGEIAVESVPNLGTSVYVCLPLAEGEHRAEAAVQEPAGAEGLPHGLRVLLVEDEAVNQMALSLQLRKMGCEADVADNGARALQMLADKDYQVVLMDIQMPLMDGIEATRAIRSADWPPGRRDVPVVALTAYAMTGDKERFLNAGMDDYISKPVDMATLRQVILRTLKAKAGNPLDPLHP